MTLPTRKVAGRFLAGFLATAIPMLLVACTSSAGSAPVSRRAAAATVPAGPSAAQLADGHWVRMAAPPIPVCGYATGLWDGTALVILNSGAPPCHSSAEAYDPATGRWSRLPTPPRATGQYPLAAWGDGRLVLAGQLGFAAAWSPAADRWQTLPRIPASSVISLTWTGTTFLAITSRQAYQATGRAWRLASGRWRSLPNLPPVWHGWYAWAPAVTVGGVVYVLAHEFHGTFSKRNISGSSRLLRRTASGWAVLPVPSSAEPGSTVFLAAVDGRLLAIGASCPVLSCPEAIGLAAVITPGSRTRATMISPPSGIGLPFPEGIAAGPHAVVVTYSVGGNTLDGSGVDSRDVAIYDPLTGRWLTGPRAANTSGSAAYWTPDGVVSLGEDGGWLLRPAGRRHAAVG